MTTPRRGRRNISENVRVLHNALTNILNDEDRAVFIRSLNLYQKDRDVIELVDSLKRVLDTSRKREVYPLLRDIIPANDKRYFEKIWHTSQGQLPGNSDKEWNITSTTRPRSHSRPLEPLRRSQIHSSLPENLEKYDSGIDIPNLKNGTTSRSPHKYPIRRLYLKRAHGTGFGFSMRGGSEHGVGLYVSSVDENSLAEYEGLLRGDHILSVNEIRFDGLSHDQAVKVIKNNKKLNMVVRSVGRIPNTFVAEATYKWIDPMGQRVSPPPNVDSNGRAMSADGIHRSDLRLLGDDDERKVNIYIDDGDKLGLRIRGGSEYGLGIYIAGVDPKSAADKAGLKVGDQIMDVNGESFLNISHADAVKVLKSAKHMMVTMKDVGRLPFTKTTTDKTNWAKGKLPNSTLQSDTESISTTVQIHAPPPTTFDTRRNTTAGITRFERRPEDSKFRQSIAGSQLMYNGTGPLTKNLSEDQARHILSENEFGTMSYYLEEYRKGFIAVDALVLALFSLFNTPAKVSLLSEIRGSIAPKDIDRFDDLVLKKEIDAIKNRKIGASSHELDAQSIRSYSSSMSSYSAHSSSSRSSARDSHGGADSRPITPPRVPEVLPSNMRYDQRANKTQDKSTNTNDKTLTNDIENGGSLFTSPNESFNDSQDAPLELSGIVPIMSSSPRNSQQSMTNGEITRNLIVGDNNRRNEDTATKEGNSKNGGSPRNESSESPSSKGHGKVESLAPKTNSSESPPETTTKKEKRAFSLFTHSKFKGSYSPHKHSTDHYITNSEDLPLKSAYDKSSDENLSSIGSSDSQLKDIDLSRLGQESRNLEKESKKLTDKEIIDKEIPSSVSVNKKTKTRMDDLKAKTESSKIKHLQKPKPYHSEPKEFDSVHLEGNQVKIDSNRALSAFAPPKPPRSFHLSEKCSVNQSDDIQEKFKKSQENEIENNVISNDSKSDQITGAKEDLFSVTPPKPKPYDSYAQQSKSKLSSYLELESQENDYVDVDGIDCIAAPPKTKPPMPSSDTNVRNSPNVLKSQNDYVDIDIKKKELSAPPMPKPYSPKTGKSTDATPHGSLDNNTTAQGNIKVLSFENLLEESKLPEKSQQQRLGSGRLETSEEKKSIVPREKPPPYSPNKDQYDGKIGKQPTSGQRLEIVDQKTSSLSSKPPPYSPRSEDSRDGMFLAMEASTTNRSGLERSTCWGDESIPYENTSLYSVVNIFPSRNTHEASDAKIGDPLKNHELETPKKPSPEVVYAQPQKKKTIESIKNDNERVNILESIKKTSNRANAKIDDSVKNHELETPKKPSPEVVYAQSQKKKTNESIQNNNERVNVLESMQKTHDNERVEIRVESIQKTHNNERVKVFESIQKTHNNERVKVFESIQKTENKVIRKVSHNENQNVSEVPPASGSLVRNMINTYNHMSDESPSTNTTNTISQKSTNRKSWDGVHNPVVPDERRKIASLENKRKVKSNSDSNLMNLPKDQQKDIQVKLRASQELLDLRQQAKSRESSTNNSPRHSIDIGQHSLVQRNPTTKTNHLVDSQHGDGYEVHLNKTSNGLGLVLEGGSDMASSSEPIKIKSVKEGPYAAHLSGKLRPGQELIQINKIPVKGMTNAMAILTLRQTYADPETQTFALVVKDA